MIIHGICETIVRDVLAHFRKIRIVQITPENFKSFMHKGIEWMNSMNQDLNIDMDNDGEFRRNQHRIITLVLTDEASSLKSAYTFPDSDFCIFKDFPHSRLIAPVISVANRDMACSCTLVWLHKYWARYHSSNLEYNDYVYVIIAEEQTKLTSREICLKGKNYSALFQSCS